MPEDLKYKTAFVTGASSGLGAAFTRMLSDAGTTVWGTSRDVSRISTDGGVRPVAMEASDARSVSAAWTLAEEQSGGIELLINNAGAAVFGRFAPQPGEVWQHQMDVLFTCPAQLSGHAATAMAARRRGVIVNVTSLAVEFPIPFMGAYTAAKAALSALTAGLAMEVAGSGVIVVDFRPGDFRTAFNDSMRDQSTQFETDPRLSAVWRRLEENLRRAPDPARAAADLQRALQRGFSGVVRSGSFFQARVAPFFDRLVPARMSRFFQRRYFRLG